MGTFTLQIAADGQKLDFEKHGYTPEIQIEESATFEIVTAKEIVERLCGILNQNEYEKYKQKYTDRLEKLKTKIPVLVRNVGEHGCGGSKSKIGLFYCFDNKIYKASEIAHVDILIGDTVSEMNRLYLLDNEPTSLLFINTDEKYNDKDICRKIGTVDSNKIFYANISEQN